MSHKLRTAIESLLRNADIDSPEFEAKIFVKEYLGKEYDRDAPTQSTFVDIPLDLKKMVGRRIAGEPLQHILGNTSFYGLELKCDRRALIPRQDTETVVDICLNIIEQDSCQTIADIGTGTGCILLALLSKRLGISGIGIDSSADALSLAQENAILTNLQSRATFLQTNWNNWNGWQECSLIVSNPPYIPTNDIQNLAVEVRSGDPKIALDGGVDGLECFRAIAETAKKQMKSKTYLVFEIGYDQRASVSNILNDNNFSQISIYKDLSGNDRVVTARKS